MTDGESLESTICSLVDYFCGVETFALILNVSVWEVERWAQGTATPPVSAYLQIMEMRSTCRRAGSLI